MNRKSGEPIYQLIFAELRQEIVSGKRNPSDMLPSENELASRYGTTRATVRKSLQELEHQGLIYSWPGKGYFVSVPAHNLFTFEFSEDETNREISYKNINVIQASEEVKEILGLKKNLRVIEISRVIKSEGHPVAYDMKYLPYEKGTPLIEKEINYSVFPEIIAAKAPPFAFYTKMEIGAELPQKQVADALQCQMSEPLLVICRYFIDHSNNCIGYGKKYMNHSYGKVQARSGYRNIS